MPAHGSLAFSPKLEKAGEARRASAPPSSKEGAVYCAARRCIDSAGREANGDLTTLVNAYALEGTPRGTFSRLPGMVGMVGLSGIVSAQNQDLVDDGYRYLLTLDATQSYSWGSASAKVRDLLVYSGNFVNFTDLDY